MLLHDSRQGANSFGLTYDFIPSGSFLGELTLGRYSQTAESAPVVNVANWYVDYTSGGSFAVQQGCGDPALVADAGVSFAPGCEGGTWVVEDAGRSRNQLRASASYYLGSHGLKGGLEYRHGSYTDRAHAAGLPSGPLVDSSGALVDAEGVNGGNFQLLGFGQCPFAALGYPDCYSLRSDDYDSGGTTNEVGIFVRDEWLITPYLTANLGVRFDSLQATGKATALHPDRRFDFDLGDMIAPRVGVIWDPFRQGRSRVFASFGRYYESVPMDVNDLAFGTAVFSFYYFAYPENGTLPTYSNLGKFIGYVPFVLDVGVDEDLTPQYSEEISVGFEYELAPGFVAGLRGVDRRVQSVVETISLDDGRTYFITNPGGTYRVNPVTGLPLDPAPTFPRPVRKYQALELTGSKRFGDSWQLYGSYVYSRNEGNYGGLYRQDNDQLLPNLTTAFDFARLLYGAYGPLTNDRPNQVKLYGSYTWPFRLVAGWNAQYLSGTPISRLGADVAYGPNERFVTPRGTAGRTSDIFQIDLHLAYVLPVGPSLQASLIADLFNVTNSRTETAVDQNWTFAHPTEADPATCGGPGTGPGTDCPAGNPNWGAPTAYQEPFRARFGVKLTW